MTASQERTYLLEAELWVTRQEELKRKYEVQATWKDERKHRGIVPPQLEI
jgi:hypothetical protein